MNKIINFSNAPIDIWELVEPMPEFADQYEIWQATFYTVYQTLGEDFTGSIVGYVEPEENPDYSYEYASGRYKLKAYTPQGELIQDLDALGDKFVQWAGLHKLPFVGYVSKDKRSEYALPEGVVWIIVPKSKEQLLSTVAAFYKRHKKKDEAPNIIDLKDFLSKSNSIGEITDGSSFVPIRKRLQEGKKRPSATKKRIEDFRSTAPEVTNEVLVNAITAKYKDFFIDNNAVAEEGIKETYRNELPLTVENVLQQIDYLVEDRNILNLMTALQHIYSPDANRIREKADKVVEQIYETACSRVCNLSDFADDEVLSYFLNRTQGDKGLAKTLNNLCCNYHCRKHNLVSCIEASDFPPFKCFDYRNGKDVTFAPTFDDAKAYNDKKTQKNERQESAITTQGHTEPKKGCLLWFILIPSSVLGLLCMIS